MTHITPHPPTITPHPAGAPFAKATRPLAGNCMLTSYFPFAPPPGRMRPAQARLTLEDRRRSLQDVPRNFGPEPCNFTREPRIFERGPFIFEKEPLIFEEESLFFKDEPLTFKEVPLCFANRQVATWKSKSRLGFSDHTSMFIGYGIHLDGCALAAL